MYAALTMILLWVSMEKAAGLFAEIRIANIFSFIVAYDFFLSFFIFVDINYILSNMIQIYLKIPT